METSLKTTLNATFEKLFINYNDISASNELRSIEEIREILIDNYIPFLERDDFFETKKPGLYTPYGFIYDVPYISAPQIYLFSEYAWERIALDIEKLLLLDAKKTFFDI